MRCAFIAEKMVTYSVAELYRVLGVSQSGFYDCLEEPSTARERRDASLLSAKARSFPATTDSKHDDPT